MLYFCIKAEDNTIWDMWNKTEAERDFVEQFCKKFKFTFSIVGKKAWRKWRYATLVYKRDYRKDDLQEDNSKRYLDDIYRAQINKNTFF